MWCFPSFNILYCFQAVPFWFSVIFKEFSQFLWNSVDFTEDSTVAAILSAFLPYLSINGFESFESRSKIKIPQKSTKEAIKCRYQRKKHSKMWISLHYNNNNIWITFLIEEIFQLYLLKYLFSCWSTLIFKSFNELLCLNKQSLKNIE